MQAKIEGVRKLNILFILIQSAAKETPFMIKKDILSQRSIYKL